MSWNDQAGAARICFERQTNEEKGNKATAIVAPRRFMDSCGDLGAGVVSYESRLDSIQCHSLPVGRGHTFPTHNDLLATFSGGVRPAGSNSFNVPCDFYRSLLPLPTNPRSLGGKELLFPCELA
jgi:hypothetical protein